MGAKPKSWIGPSQPDLGPLYHPSVDSFEYKCMKEPPVSDLHTPMTPMQKTTNHQRLRSESGRAPSNPMVWAGIVAVVVSLAWWYPHWKTWLLSAPLAPKTEDGAKGPGSKGGFGGFSGFAGGRAQPVSVGVATLMDVNDTVNAIGTLTAMNTAQVRAKVDGELKSILFTEGKTVKAGDVIAELDSRSFQVALSQAQGQLERDQALLRNAQLDQSRYQALWAEDAISKQQLDTQAALVQQLAGTVRTDQALVDSAKLNLEYTRVVAPISGRLGLKQVELGSLVRAGDANGLVTITQTQPMAVVFSIPEKNVGLVQEKLSKSQALPVVARDRDLQSVLAKGQVLTTDNAIDVSTSTLKLKAILDNAKGQLFPNQFANIELQLQILKNTLAVPTNAVQRGSIGTYVLGVNPDKTVKMIRVSLGPIQGDWTAVQALKGDLAPGTQVVTDGADRLRDGSKVELVKQDPSMQGMRADSRPSAGATAAPTDAKFDSKSNAASPMSPTAPTKDGAGKEGGGKWSAANGASAPVQPSGAAPSSQATAGAPASGDAPSGERPRWMDRVPPEMIDKIRAMSPEERRAFFQKMRERRQNAGGDQ